jgi:hypothetical protein
MRHPHFLPFFALILIITLAHPALAATPSTTPQPILTPADLAWTEWLLLAFLWLIFVPAALFGPIVRYFTPAPKKDLRFSKH